MIQPYNAAPSGKSVAGPGPVEPCLQAKADELIKWISELESNVGTVDRVVFGRGDGLWDAGDGRSLPIQGYEKPNNAASLDNLAAKIHNACTRAASLCGQTSTIVRDLTA